MPGCCPDGAREGLPIPKDGEVVNADVLGVGRGDCGFFVCGTGMLLVLIKGRRSDGCERRKEEGTKSTYIFGGWRNSLG